MAAPTYTTRAAFQTPDVLGIPFDVQGAVGPEYIIAVNNTTVTAFNKAGTQIWIDQLWDILGASALSTFDPRIVFDPVAERFYICAVRGRADSNPSGSPSGSQLRIAISKSATPGVGDWNTLVQEVGESVEHWLDYPMIGYNANEVTIAGKLFPKDGEAQHTHVFGYLIPKADLIKATPDLNNLQAIEITDNDTFFPHPVVDVDAATSGHSLWRWIPPTSIDRLNVVQGSPSTIPLDEAITYTGAIGRDGDQPVIPEQLDNHANARISAHPVKIGGFVYIVLSGRDGADGTIVVFKIDASDNTITAQTTLHESGLDLLYPSIAVNASGHIVIGCTATGAATLPGVMVFVGQDDGATMTFAAGDTIKDGERVYDEDSGGSVRWGDYSAVEIDPTDNNRFWSFQSYGHDNGSDNTGRQIEITEIITEPAGILGRLGLSVLGFGAVASTAVPIQVFRTLAADSYVDGAITSQVLVDGAIFGDSLVDGAIAAQSEPN